MVRMETRMRVSSDSLTSVFSGRFSREKSSVSSTPFGFLGDRFRKSVRSARISVFSVIRQGGSSRPVSYRVGFPPPFPFPSSYDKANLASKLGFYPRFDRSKYIRFLSVRSSIIRLIMEKRFTRLSGGFVEARTDSGTSPPI